MKTAAILVFIGVFLTGFLLWIFKRKKSVELLTEKSEIDSLAEFAEAPAESKDLTAKKYFRYRKKSRYYPAESYSRSGFRFGMIMLAMRVSGGTGQKKKRKISNYTKPKSR